MRSLLILIIVIVVLAFTGCEDILKVQNPNNVLEDDLNNPSSAASLVNGALATVMQGIGYVMTPYETVTDEVYWVGSRDAWRQLDQGFLSDPNNEFVDGAWPYICEGRWMADKAVSLLEEFNKQGTLRNKFYLVNAYIIQALVRIAAADMFDDFIISDKMEAKPPLGEQNMYQMYDQAIEILNKAEVLALAQPSGTTRDEMLRRIYALRARARHAKAVWFKIRPKSSTPPSNPYVNDPNAKADAEAALSLMSGDYKWRFDYLSSLTFNSLAWEIVGRSELRLERLPLDPVTGGTDTRMKADSSDFVNRTKYQDRYSPITVTSRREMHLIIAEYYLATGDVASARAELNRIRALDGLPPYTDSHNIEQALRHERRANLYLQGRRLADMYRFGVKDSRWLPNSDAYTTVGYFLVVPIRERRANPYYPESKR